MRWFPGLGLLASAFAPLIAVLAVVRWADLGVWAWILLGLCALSLLWLWAILASTARLQVHVVRTRAVKSADENVMRFTYSYLVPVIVAVFAPPSLPSLVGEVMLVVLSAVIYVRGGLFHLNPTLSVLGWRTCEVTAASGEPFWLLTRAGHLPQQGEVAVRRLSASVAFHVRRP